MKKPKDGILNYNPESGLTTISYNGRRFYTKDKSVIAMAYRGNVAGAALRWTGKTSASRALRRTNEAATKPLYDKVSKDLFRKIFLVDKKEAVGTSAAELREFVKKYKETQSEVDKYVEEAITDNLPFSEIQDRLPADLRSRINNVIRYEAEKAYAEKGEIDESDLENINDRIINEFNDYIIENPDMDTGTRDLIAQYAETPINEAAELERY